MSSSHHQRVIVNLVASAAVLVSTQATAGPISATANLTNGPLGTIDLPFADSASQTPGSVAINQLTTVTGNRTGTLLGQVIVNGTTDGLFDMSVLGQQIHAHETGFQFTETITNTAATPQAVTMDILINAGELRTLVRETAPLAGQFVETGYEVVIRFLGSTVFESRVTLRQEAAANGVGTTASLAQSGTNLGGLLTPPAPGAREEYDYSWGPYTQTLNLGVLAAGQAGVLDYEVRAFAASDYIESGTWASIGDPFNVSWIGGQGTFGFSPLSLVSLIDIQPGNDKNFVNPHSRQLVRVAVLGSEGFDATQVNPSTVMFGPAGASPVLGGRVRDVNEDGYPDMLFGFRMQDTGIACTDVQATLSGATFDAQTFTASDTVTTRGCRAHDRRERNTAGDRHREHHGHRGNDEYREDMRLKEPEISRRAWSQEPLPERKEHSRTLWRAYWDK